LGEKNRKPNVGGQILDFVITCGSWFLINFKIREHPFPRLQKTFRNKLTIRSGVFENFQTKNWQFWVASLTTSLITLLELQFQINLASLGF
jgi:hypothetical protein